MSTPKNEVLRLLSGLRTNLPNIFESRQKYETLKKDAIAKAAPVDSGPRVKTRANIPYLWKEPRDKEISRLPFQRAASEGLRSSSERFLFDQANPVPCAGLPHSLS